MQIMLGIILQPSTYYKTRIFPVQMLMFCLAISPWTSHISWFLFILIPYLGCAGSEFHIHTLGYSGHGCFILKQNNKFSSVSPSFISCFIKYYSPANPTSFCKHCQGHERLFISRCGLGRYMFLPKQQHLKPFCRTYCLEC